MTSLPALRSKKKIVVIGMAARFGGCEDLHAFWRVLRKGQCTVVSDGSPDHSMDRPSSTIGFRRTRARIIQAEFFDHKFFGFSHRDATLLDPQQRIGLEVAWHAIEDAGIVPGRFSGQLGVYASIGYSAYRDAMLDIAERQRCLHELRHGCTEDFFASRLAVALDATGPCAVYGSACSSSLLALAHAVRDLRVGACDAAVVCASSIGLQSRPSVNALHSPDGMCRPYDAAGAGFVGGDGAVAIILRRERDYEGAAYASILGIGISNDGANRMSFTSPSPRGQYRACSVALKDAAVDPESISYIEGHGSGTKLGDAVELEGLAEGYKSGKIDRSPISIGSVKGNVGHCDVAAGLAGFVKTVLCLRHRMLVPTVGFQNPTPLVDWEALPFEVQTGLSSWINPLLRAGVHSVGMGGTNVHVIVEQASDDTSEPHLEGTSDLKVDRVDPIALCVSAKTPSSLDAAVVALREELMSCQLDNQQLSDVARMLRSGRSAHRYRRYVVAGSKTEAIAQFEDCKKIWEVSQPSEIIFCFGGLKTISSKACEALAATELGGSIVRHAQGLLPTNRASQYKDKDGEIVDEYHVALQIAFARSWEAQGVRPNCVIGYSLGDFPSLAIGGILRDETAVLLAQQRREIFEKYPIEAATLTIYASAEHAEQIIANQSVEAFLCAEIAPQICVAVGVRGAMQAMASHLKTKGVSSQLVCATRAPHCPLSHEVATEFSKTLRGTQFGGPRIKVVLPAWDSVLEPGLSFDATYLREQITTRLKWNSSVMKADEGFAAHSVFLEINGPPALSALGARAESPSTYLTTLPTQPSEFTRHWTQVTAALWAAGAALEEPIRWNREAAKCIPRYPFERTYCGLDGGADDLRSSRTLAALPAANTQPEPIANAPVIDNVRRRKFTPKPIDGGNVQECERLIKQIFAEEIGIGNCSEADDFFSLGGTSIAALNAVARIRAELGIQLTVALFLEARTPHKISRLPIFTHSNSHRDGKSNEHHKKDIPVYFLQLLQKFDPDLHACWIEGKLRPIPDHGPLLSILTDEIHLHTKSRVFPHELTKCYSIHDLMDLINRVREWSVKSVRNKPALVVGHLRPESIGESREGSNASRNAPAIFLLSSARSGSTLLRVMLAGHPDLFAPPELHLLPYRDLGKRRQGLTSHHFGAGLERAWRQLRGLSTDSASREIAEWEIQATTTQETYARLQQAAWPKMLIDKSPSNAGSLDYLAKIDAHFDSAYVIYLHRHPIPSIVSYVRNRLNSIGERDTSPWEAAQEHWIQLNANICSYLGLHVPGLPRSRSLRPHVRVAFEDLVSDPETTLRTTCAALGLPFDPHVLEITGSERMRDGPGDPGFASRMRIDPTTAWEWQDNRENVVLTPQAIALASALGYSV